jgi:hypothetical protein
MQYIAFGFGKNALNVFIALENVFHMSRQFVRHPYKYFYFSPLLLRMAVIFGKNDKNDDNDRPSRTEKK